MGGDVLSNADTRNDRHTERGAEELMEGETLRS